MIFILLHLLQIRFKFSISFIDQLWNADRWGNSALFVTALWHCFDDVIGLRLKPIYALVFGSFFNIFLSADSIFEVFRFLFAIFLFFFLFLMERVIQRIQSWTFNSFFIISYLLLHVFLFFFWNFFGTIFMFGSFAFSNLGNLTESDFWTLNIFFFFLTRWNRDWMNALIWELLDFFLGTFLYHFMNFLHFSISLCFYSTLFDFNFLWFEPRYDLMSRRIFQDLLRFLYLFYLMMILLNFFMCNIVGKPRFIKLGSFELNFLLISFLLLRTWNVNWDIFFLLIEDKCLFFHFCLKWGSLFSNSIFFSAFYFWLFL